MSDVGDGLTQHPAYALGHSDRELDRLSAQARLIDPVTRRFFHDAGIVPGMHVLDVGRGAGDVAFLVADLVGESGEVIGVDRLACPTFVKQTFHEFADQSIRFSRWARAYYYLRPAAGPRQSPSRGVTSLGLQMDSDSVSLLEGSPTVRRSHLHQCASPAWITARQTFCLTAQLRCPCRRRQAARRFRTGRGERRQRGS